ncbi:nucleoside hydrolase [[Mycobacterium] wendilense]|uniref:Nucleoside hydrolase n=1 Tax=[Mycobacterium] wendilense TaxID=3064284 RepID=A0ABM9MH58_9MYCO|nr:nucleoside hydrolase [Mycolicibacterium sp. MU0050]CAJ1585064.1 nucleoside hydrolase [Mycolicibacterium sp. MU0050]
MPAVFADLDTGVDDAMALMYLLASAEVDLVGIASTAGNVSAHQVCRNNRALLELCGRPEIPVSLGSEQPLSIPLRTAEDTHGPAGLGYAELADPTAAPTAHDAAQAWIRAARAHPGELVGLVTGPMTNLALALRADPELPQLLRRLVIMGGSFDYRGNTSPVTEWNIHVDPEAAAEVFAAFGERAEHTGELPLVCGLNITESIVLTPQILARLAAAAGTEAATMSPDDDLGTRSAAGNPLIRVLEDAMRFYFEFHHRQGEGYLAHLHDPFAAAVALDPALVTARPATIDVELHGTLTRGMTVADIAGHWGREPNAAIVVGGAPQATRPLAEVFFDRFIERVGVFLRRLS